MRKYYFFFLRKNLYNRDVLFFIFKFHYMVDLTLIIIKTNSRRENEILKYLRNNTLTALWSSY